MFSIYGRELVRWMRRFFCAVGALMVLLTFTPLTEWAANLMSVAWQDDNSHGTLVVLGGSMYNLPDQTPIAGENTHLRCLHAVWLWKRNHYRRILVVGSGGASQIMQGFLMAHGVPREVIEQEPTSGTTRENAVAVRKYLADLAEAPSDIVLLTSDYHTYRASQCFRRVGLKVKTLGAPDILKRSLRWDARWTCFCELCSEATRIAYYRWQGWI